MTSRRTRTLTLPGVGLALGAFMGCNDFNSASAPLVDLPPSHPLFLAPESMRSWTGLMVPEATGRAIMARLARQVALALSDAGLRSRVYQALHGSPYREHKLHFRTMLQSTNLGLLDAMAATEGAGRDAILASLDSVMDLEFYMPVKEHWATWDGGPMLLVATAHHDGDIPSAFDLSGRPVGLSSPWVPPATPTLALVPAEMNFS